MYVKNAWYAAGWSKDIDTKPLARTFLDQKVVLFRTEGGRLAAFEDRCCHRALPLSRGEVRGEHLVCGYHGLRFDATGRCVEVPGQRQVPPGAQVRSFPTVEKWNVAWIWMGDADLKDESGIPEMPWLNDANWTTTPGYIHVRANYLFIIDNLLDLTHVTYVHKNTLAGDPREATTPTKTERIPGGIQVGRWMLDFVPPPLFAKAGRFTGNVDRWQFVTWHAPATVYLDVGCAKVGTGAPQGNRSHGISIWSSHLITPETAESSHYLFCYARNFGLDDPNLSQLLFEGSKATFLEDTAILEAVQTNRSAGSLDGLIDINADAAQLQARRLLQQIIATESTA
jgi:phenylpropionate dioxygenase-like ring-hydroxylating dioxygenase large terminal subunit